MSKQSKYCQMKQGKERKLLRYASEVNLSHVAERRSLIEMREDNSSWSSES